MPLMMDAFVRRLARSPDRVQAVNRSKDNAPEPDKVDRPTKRLKISEDEQPGDTSSNLVSEEEDLAPDSPSEHDRFVEEEDAPSATPFESSVPDTKTDKAAIQEYEEGRANEATSTDETRSRVEKRMWIKGRSSIYVDAFNLALDTVLEDEAHLFDQREQEVFQQWKSLSYECQYL
jgi:Fanconi-associated nuclease 1